MTVKMVPYLVFDGKGREAIDFYKRALDAEVLGVMTFGESPSDPNMPLPAEAKDRIMHAMVRIGEAELMLSDSFPGQSVPVGEQVTICIMTNARETSQRFFDALAEGGRVTMPLQETFFSPAYGMVTDRFGVPFQIYTEGKQ